MCCVYLLYMKVLSPRKMIIPDSVTQKNILPLHIKQKCHAKRCQTLSTTSNNYDRQRCKLLVSRMTMLLHTSYQDSSEKCMNKRHD